MSEDKLSKHDGDEDVFSVFYPVDYIIAAFERADQADGAMRALREAGFTGKKVLRFSSEEMLSRHEDAKQDAGLLDKLKVAVSQTLGDESNYAEQYVELAQQGHTFLFIHAPDDETMQRVSELIQPFDPKRARHYSSTVITDITYGSGLS